VLKPIATPALAAFKLFFLTSPLAIVVVLSIVIGLLMIVLFGYTSNQKAIKVAKDQLKAHLLAVRLFQDQLHVVMGSYSRILRGTGRYLKLAFMPLLYVIIPITLLIVQLDRYLGSTGIQANAPFLLTVAVNNSDGAERRHDTARCYVCVSCYQCSDTVVAPTKCRSGRSATAPQSPQDSAVPFGDRP